MKRALGVIGMLFIIPVLDMLRLVLWFVFLKRLQVEHPELFDGKLALANIEASLEEDRK